MTQHVFSQINTDRIDTNQWQKAPNYGMILIAILEPFLKRVPRYERKKKRQPWSCVAMRMAKYWGYISCILIMLDGVDIYVTQATLFHQIHVVNILENSWY